MTGGRGRNRAHNPPEAECVLDARRIAAGQRDFLARHTDVFDRRVIDVRVVEGHGDLRPEHVCLESPPQVIDCLEFSRELRIFSRELRIVDSAEELGFLALECVRAKLAVWHLREPGTAGASKWTERARDYMRLADRHLAAAQSPLMLA